MLQKYTQQIWILLAESFPMVVSGLSYPFRFVQELISRVFTYTGGVIQLYFSCYSRGWTGGAASPRPLWVLCLASGRRCYARTVVGSTAPPAGGPRSPSASRRDR